MCGIATSVVYAWVSYRHNQLCVLFENIAETVPMIQTDQDEFIASYIELNQLHHKFKRISLVLIMLFVELLLV